MADGRLRLGPDSKISGCACGRCPCDHPALSDPGYSWGVTLSGINPCPLQGPDGRRPPNNRYVASLDNGLAGVYGVGWVRADPVRTRSGSYVLITWEGAAPDVGGELYFQPDSQDKKRPGDREGRFGLFLRLSTICGSRFLDNGRPRRNWGRINSLQVFAAFWDAAGQLEEGWQLYQAGVKNSNGSVGHITGLGASFNEWHPARFGCESTSRFSTNFSELAGGGHAMVHALG